MKKIKKNILGGNKNMNHNQNKKTGKLAGGLAFIALKCSKLAANSICTITYHDIEKPEELKKLRNFSNEKNS